MTQLVAGMTFPFDLGGKVESLSLQQINARLYDADRSVRQAAARQKSLCPSPRREQGQPLLAPRAGEYSPRRMAPHLPIPSP